MVNIKVKAGEKRQKGYIYFVKGENLEVQKVKSGKKKK